MSLILTVDLGTTLFKLALFDEAGEARRIVRVEAPIERPNPGWCQIDPTAFKNCLVAGIAQLRGQAPEDFAQIAAICFSTQANSFLLLDRNQVPLGPIILWPDNRAGDPAPPVKAYASDTAFHAQTGIPTLTGEISTAKLYWLQQTQQRAWREVGHICFISDLLTHWFTGEFCVEAGVAGLTGGADINTLAWRPAFLDLFSLDSGALPRIVRAGTDLGPIQPTVADELRLPRACRFVAGCLDQYAGCIGTGSISPGQVTETTGTVLAVVRCAEQLSATRRDSVFQGPSYAPDRFWQMTFSNTSANLLDWYRQHNRDNSTMEQFIDAAEREPDGPVPLVIAPLEPGSTPAQALKGIQPGHTAGQAVRAIMKCVAQALRDQVRMLSNGMLPARICSAGGGARSDLWMQVKADTVGTTFCRTVCEEPTSLGAAMLAAKALGWGSLSELADRWVRFRDEFQPSAPPAHREPK
jgi:sugar (pentulose or hexulose) kinase